jgi:nitrate/nitrite transporter NarK
MVSAIPGISGAAGLAALTIATAGILCGFTLFWAIPTALLSGTAAAAGIAWINSVGNLAGYVSPYAVGEIRDRTHSMTLALLVLAGAQLMSAALTLYVTRKRRQS